MSNPKISSDFFHNLILRGNKELLNSFSPSVNEHFIGSDIFFSIVEDSEHHRINKRITNFIFNNVPLNSCACGFVKNTSYYDFLSPHISGYYFLRLDIKKFFHSFKIDYIELLLESFFSKEKDGFTYSPYDIALLSVSHTVSDEFEDFDLRGNNILPIGFPSSPVISNIIFRKIDILIQKYCENKKIIYTRYADDMLFSSFDTNYIHSDEFEREISVLISLLSLKLNKNKKRVCENTISLNGYTIQNEKPKSTLFFSSFKEKPVGSIRLSNKKLKIIIKMIYLLERNIEPIVIMEKLFNINFYCYKFKYRCNRRGFFIKYVDHQLQNKIKGYRSYLISLITYNNKIQCVTDENIKKYSHLVDKLNEYIK